MKAEFYELVTLHEKLQALECCGRILDAWDGFGKVARAIGTETKKIERRIQEIMSAAEKEL